MAINPEKIIIITTLRTINDEPLLIAWDRGSGEMSFPNTPQEQFTIAAVIRERIAFAEEGGVVDLFPVPAYWRGVADMKNPAFVRAVLESVGLYPSLQPPPYLAHLGKCYQGMELPPELAAIDPWTPYPPLPPGAIA